MLDSYAALASRAMIGMSEALQGSGSSARLTKDQTS